MKKMFLCEINFSPYYQLAWQPLRNQAKAGNAAAPTQQIF